MAVSIKRLTGKNIPTEYLPNEVIYEVKDNEGAAKYFARHLDAVRATSEFNMRDRKKSR